MIAVRMVWCLCCPCRILHYAGIWPFSTHVSLPARSYIHIFSKILGPMLSALSHHSFPYISVVKGWNTIADY